MKYLLILFFSLPFIVSAQSTFQETMMHDNENRSYYIHLPPQYDGTAKLPVVFVLHGLGDTANNMTGAGFTQIGDQEGFISVYPQGLESQLGNAWNNGSNIGLLGFTPDDIGFISSLIDLMTGTYNADETRVYACGFSMGGIMSHYLGCNLSDKITAIASQAGTMANSITAGCNPDRAFSAMHVHGDADGTVNYNGDALYGLASAVETIEVWAAANNCSETPVETSLPDSANDGYTITKADYAPCDDNSEVILMTVHGADHVWLGPNNDIFTSLEFWNFFANKVNTDATTTPIIDHQTLVFSLFPNPAQDVITITGLEKEMNITITDLAGKLLLQTQSSEFIPVSGLNSGSYFIQITDLENGISGTQKFIKL